MKHPLTQWTRFWALSVCCGIWLNGLTQPIDSLWQQAGQAYDLGRYAESEQLYKQLVDMLSPEDGDRYWRANTLYAGSIISQYKKEEGFSYLDKLSQEVISQGTPYQQAMVSFSLGGAHNQFQLGEQALVHLKNCYRLLHQPPLDTSLLLVKSVIGIGNAFNHIGRPDSALKHFRTAEKLLAATPLASFREYTTLYNNLGITLVDLTRYQEGIEYYSKALSLNQQHLPHNSPPIARNYNNLGVAYDEMGDYGNALSHYDQAVFLKIQTNGPNAVSLAPTYFNMAGAYSSLELYDTAEVYYQKSLQLYQKRYGPDHYQLGVVLSDVANNRIVSGFPKEAFEPLEQSKEILAANFGDGHPILLQIYLIEGFAWQQLGQHQKALNSFHKGEKIIQPIVDSWGEGLVICRQMQAESLAALGQYDSAQARVENMERYLLPPDLQQEIAPADKAPEQAFPLAKLYYVRGLVALQKALTSPEKISLWQDAYQRYQLTVSTIEHILRHFRRDASQELVVTSLTEVYHEAIEVCYHLHRLSGEEIYLETAFQLAEASKARLLQQSIQQSQARAFSGIPDLLLKKEEQLRSELDWCRRQAYEQSIEPTDSLGVPYWRSRVYRLQTSLDSLIEVFEMNYPAYHALKYARGSIDIGDLIQQLAESDTRLIELVAGDSLLFVFYVDASGIQLKVLPERNYPYDQIRKMLEVFRHRDPSEQYAQILPQMHQWYQHLLVPPDARQLVNHLQIVPDGLFSYLPFELLLMEPPVAGTSPEHALNSFTFRYAYSASLPKVGSQASARLMYGGFAPRYDAAEFFNGISERAYEGLVPKWSSFAPLIVNFQEVKQAASLFEGDPFLESSATEDRFRKVGKDYRLLHLAMHAFVNDRHPLFSGLAFSRPDRSKDSLDGFLFAHEIYNLPLKADLTVLSACETGQGKLLKGEGVMSLALAFRYAGCPSVIMSLWKVEDQATGFIMKELFANLEEGLTREEALRQAKLAYLRQHPNSAPSEWAGFVIVGEGGTLQPSGAPLILWGVLGFMLVGGLIFFFWKSS
ncbi:MAG: CHAT domain-containing tetratricopeptide repeat protein [Bacteroidota bacterium]